MVSPELFLADAVRFIPMDFSESNPAVLHPDPGGEKRKPAKEVGTQPCQAAQRSDASHQRPFPIYAGALIAAAALSLLLPGQQKKMQAPCGRAERVSRTSPGPGPGLSIWRRRKDGQSG
jgi:hypothetical protein